jgi:glycosyltransferase involved in cell wall biosynthesis
MRFLTVTHFFESHGGGIERVAGHLCRNLAAQGHECEWAASAADSAPADSAITALPLRCINPTERLTGLPMPIPGLTGLQALSSALGRADVVIIHDALYCTSIAAMMLARARNVPVILIQHIGAIEFASATMRKIMALANHGVTHPMLGAADQVIFISNTVREVFSPVRMKREARLLFNGVDDTAFYRGPAYRRIFGLPDASKVAVFAGRFVQKKGLGVIRALAARRPDIQFVLAGSGPISPADWNLPNVRLLGTLKPADIGELFRAADMLLLPSVGEGYPLVIQEAMACGLPVICGAESAYADPIAARWLKGVDIDLASPEATARRIAPLLDLAALSSQDRDAMAAYAASAYSWPSMAAAVANIAAEIRTAR